MNSDSTVIDYDELCILYKAMMTTLNHYSVHQCDFEEEYIIKEHHLAAKLMTYMLQTRPKNNTEDPF